MRESGIRRIAMLSSIFIGMAIAAHSVDAGQRGKLCSHHYEVAFLHTLEDAPPSHPIVFNRGRKQIFQERLQALEAPFRDEAKMERVQGVVEKLRNPHLQGVRGVASLDHGWAELGPGAIRSQVRGHEIVYYGKKKDRRMVEIPAAGVYWIENFSPKGATRDYYWYLPKERGFSVDVALNRALSTRLASEYSYASGQIPKIRERVRTFGASWEKHVFQEALDRFVGKAPVIWPEGPKVMYFNPENGFLIAEDPVGKYFRIFKRENGEDIALTWEGTPVPRQERGAEAKTHFAYDHVWQKALADPAPLIRRMPIPAKYQK